MVKLPDSWPPTEDKPLEKFSEFIKATPGKYLLVREQEAERMYAAMRAHLSGSPCAEGANACEWVRALIRKRLGPDYPRECVLDVAEMLRDMHAEGWGVWVRHPSVPEGQEAPFILHSKRAEAAITEALKRDAEETDD